MLKTICAFAVISLALAMPALAQEKPAKLDEKAFAADYKALLKKHPGAVYRFHMFDENEGKTGRSPRCGPDCGWYPEVGACSCPPEHGEMQRLWSNRPAD